MRPAIAAGLLLGAVTAGINEIAEILPERDSHTSISNSLDWKIESHGFKPDGYYVLDTEHEYKNGTWEKNTDGQLAVSIPENMDETQPHTKLKGIKTLDANGRRRFRLPIAIGTEIESLLLRDTHGEPVEYTVFKYNDGTMEVVAFDDDSNAISVEESLIPSPDMPHAAQRLKPIDVTKLSQEVKARLDESGDTSEIGHNISKHQVYSINPPDKEKLDKGNETPETYINEEVNLSGSFCEPANAASVLLSSAKVDDWQFVNLAAGYIAADQIGSSDKGFLDGLHSHAYALSNHGYPVDATGHRERQRNTRPI